MKKTLSTIEASIKIFDTIRRLWIRDKSKVLNRIREPLRLEKVTDDFFNSYINYGALITTSGYLSNYGYSYRPRTYMATIPDRGKDEKLGLKYDEKVKRVVEERQMTVKYRLFQFPIQIIPPFESELGRYRLMYLYPEGFFSFILTKDEEKEKKKSLSDHLKITSSNMAVPVLMDESNCDKFSNSFVKITALISPIPSEQIEYFSQFLCDTRRRFSYNYFRPFSPNLGFCLDCRNYLDFDIIVQSRPESISGALYIEAHFENLDNDKYQRLIDKAVPNRLNFNLAYAGHPGITHYITDSDISVIGIEPYTYGFYIETDIIDNRKFETSLRKLQASYDTFRKKANSLVRSEFNTEAKLKPDFVFDFRRQKLFHPDGVLVSQEVSNILEKNPNLIDTIKWLKQ